jgi:retron-type reverse transcriptase
MHRELNRFDRVVAFDNLYRAFRGASHGKRDRPEVRDFEYHLETRLWEIRRALLAGTHRWGAYREFLIRDPKRRMIRAAPFRDRVVHHALFNILDPIIRRQLIVDTYACIPGRGTHRAVRRFQQFVEARKGEGYVLQCDIRDYFGSVDHQVLLALLRRRIGDARLMDLVSSLVRHGATHPGRGMPIGNLTSQLFANLYLDPLDHFVKETLRVCHYLRYMDDFILLTADRAEAGQLRAQIAAFLEVEVLLGFNPRRVVIAPIGCPRDVLGYVRHGDGRMRIRRRSARRLWSRLKALPVLLEQGRVSDDFVRSSIGSWFGLAKHADAFRLSRSIFAARDVRNIGKRLLVRGLASG